MSGNDENDSSEVRQEISIRFPLTLAPVPLVGVDATAKDPIPFIDEPARGALDPQNIIYVNAFPEMKWAKDELRRLHDANVLSSQYFSVKAAQSALAKIKSGQLPLASDKESQIKRSNYRAKVIDFVITQSSWLRSIASTNYQREFDVEKKDFHSTLLGALLKGLPIPTSAYSGFEKVLSSIFDTVEQTKNQRTSLTQWIMGFTYTWDAQQERVFTSHRTISYQINQSMKEFVSGKSHVTQVHIDMSYRQDDFDFTESIWNRYRDDVINAISKNGDLYGVADVPV